MVIMIDITQIVIAVVGVIALVLTGFAIPKLKSQVGQEKYTEAMDKLSTITYYARIVTSAVEQMFPGEGSKKLAEATSRLESMLNAKGVNFDADEIRTAIESAVYEINHRLLDTDC